MAIHCNKNRIVSWSIVLLSVFTATNCIRWYMPPNSQKCLKEELRQDVLVKGMYEVALIEGQQVDYVVKDSKSHILAQKEDINSGKFTFSVETYDMFEICFTSKVLNNNNPIVQEIFLDIKSGVDAKNYEGVAEAYKLKPIELVLKQLEDLTQFIVLRFDDMKKIADEMRNTNESTTRRVLYFGTFSITCLLLLATWQVFYLRRYFKAKKLIE